VARVMKLAFDTLKSLLFSEGGQQLNIDEWSKVCQKLHKMVAK
jgi:hypothetical protein